MSDEEGRDRGVKRSHSSPVPDQIVCQACDGIYSQEEWWDHIISKGHQQELHQQDVMDRGLVYSDEIWVPLPVNGDDSPWRESDDDFAFDENNNLVPYSWRAREAATLAAQTGTTSALEHKANLKWLGKMEKWKEQGKGKGKQLSTSASSNEPQVDVQEDQVVHRLPPCLSQDWFDDDNFWKREMCWLKKARTTTQERQKKVDKAALTPLPKTAAFTASYIVPPHIMKGSEVYPEGGSVLVQKWFDMKVDDNKVITLTTLEPKSSTYLLPLNPRDEFVIKERLLHMVEDMYIAISEGCNIIHSALRLHKMVMDNDLGVSGWRKECPDMLFMKMEMKEVLEESHMIQMKLVMIKEHLEWQPDSPTTASLTPWRYQQFLAYVKKFYFSKAKHLSNTIKARYLVLWQGTPYMANDKCWKWP